jgi:CHRD domain/PEP-CTERM motif
MSKSLASLLTIGAMLSAPMASQAVVHTFNAALNGASEAVPNLSLGTATAILSYDDKGTIGTGDDDFIFSMFASGMTGPATAAHIHSAPVGVAGPVILSLSGAGFTYVPLPTGLLVGGGPLAAPSPTFLGTLTAGLGYVNVHSAAFGGGEIRGQLIEVSAVPEPSTYAMLLAGVAALAFVARRRQR